MLTWKKLEDGSGYASNLKELNKTSPLFTIDRNRKRFTLRRYGNIIADDKPFAVCVAIANLIL